MPVLSDSRKELFAVRRVMALRYPESAGQSYLSIYPETPSTEASLLGDKLEKSKVVRTRINEIVSQGAEIASRQIAESLIMGEKDLKKFCHDVLQAKPSEASMDNPLCDVKFTRDGPVPIFPAKMEALNTLGRLHKLLGADSNVNITLPSWEPTHLEQEMGTMPVIENSPQEVQRLDYPMGEDN